MAGRWLVQAKVAGRGALVDRALAWARRRQQRVRGHNPWEIAVHTVRAAVDHRLTGHAAEMSCFALLTLVPSTVAVAAALGFLERLVGPQRIARGQDEAIVALGGLVLTWWLSSHLFASTSHALDRAYGVKDRRPTLRQRFVALASVVVVALTLGILVVGPPGGGPDIAERLGLGRAVALAWGAARWPALLLILIGFLTCLHRFSPNVEHLEGLCAGRGAGDGPVGGHGGGIPDLPRPWGGVAGGVAPQDDRVAVIGRAVGAVVATVLWT